MPTMSAGNIKVVVRCRPLNARELARGATCLIKMEGNQTILFKSPESRSGKDAEDIKAFTFDKSYWSANKRDSHYADQDTVYQDLGEDLLSHAFDGYNCYGQTGSGKSYSMMGYGEDKGLIPRTCTELFERIEKNNDSHLQYQVEVSYMEIYNEKVRDLLNPKNKDNLKVREHPSLGPYVEDLARLVVSSSGDINHLMDEGNKARTVAATNMNETSSRSHAVFTVFLTQKRKDDLTGLESEIVARISLVDLAGSERANSTGATGVRLKEGANINRSLTTLGKVIAGLAEQSGQETKKGRKKDVFIPYRDSVLTWLLKDSLGGNSKTAMIAAISPADYEETLSTLRYADQAKRIKNKAVVNEDPNAKLIRDLKDELDLLRGRLKEYAPEEVEHLMASSVYKSQHGTPMSNGNGNGNGKSKAMLSSVSVFDIVDSHGNVRKMTKEDIVEQLQSSEKLLANLNETWEEKMKRTEQIQIQREKALEELGIMVHKNTVGIHAPKKMPHLVNLNEDPLMSECLMYQIKQGITRVGRCESSVQADIRLSGENVQDNHCWFSNDQGAVMLHPSENALTMVNGARLREPERLRSGYRIIIGHHHIFRFNHPEEVRRERDLFKVVTDKSAPEGSVIMDDEDVPESFVDSPSALGSEAVDWNFARREAVWKQYDQDTNLVTLTDEEIENLYRGITKIRNYRRTRSGSRNENEDDASTKGSLRNSAAFLLSDEGAESVYTDFTLVRSEQDDLNRIDRLPEALDMRKRSTWSSSVRLSRSLSVIDCPYQRELAMRVITRWRRLRSISMAKVVLTEAVTLKEANVMSRMLKKDVVYQFTVIEEEPFMAPRSLYDRISNQHPFEMNEDGPMSSSVKPCIGVRVIDKKHRAVYTWSLEKMKQNIKKMYQMYNFIDRPQYRRHLHLEDAFFDSNYPKYTLIGTAYVSFRNIAFSKTLSATSEIICRHTGQVRGTVHLVSSPVARSIIPSHRQSQVLGLSVPQPSSSPIDSTLRVGQQVLFKIDFQDIVGVDEDTYSEVHVQCSLSSFGAAEVDSPGDKVFASKTVSDFGRSPIPIQYTLSLTMDVTPTVLDTLLSDTIPVNVYGRATPNTLDSIERWDAMRERDALVVPPSPATPLPTNYARLSLGHIVERRSEEELWAPERHDVLAWAQVTESGPSGQYHPVEFTRQHAHDRGCFMLRQGLQRNIVLVLVHTSGHQFKWTHISKVTVSDIRLQDANDHITYPMSQESVDLSLLPHGNRDVEYFSDGTSRIHRSGSWNSSQHQCLLLDRTTDPSYRVLLKLTWQVQVDKCMRPVEFSMDIAVQMRDRETSPVVRLYRLLALGQRPRSVSSGVFIVHLRPPMPRDLAQLWRLNTASKYVRGEEDYLGSWRPRGISLIKDFERIQSRLNDKRSMAVTRQILQLFSTKEKASTIAVSSPTLLHIVHLWTRKFYSGSEIPLYQEPPIMQDTGDLSQLRPHTIRLIAESKLVSDITNVSKRGFLWYQICAATDQWDKRWCVIRRPYIMLYSDRREIKQEGMINVTSVRIDYNEALEKMILRKHVFAIYTSNNAYMLQAGTEPDMLDWISKIDPTFSITQR